MFQQHLAIFHKSRPSAGVVPTPMALVTNGFYRNYQKLGGGQKIIWGGICPPCLPPPGAATGHAESWYFFQLHKNFFRAAQIDLELHILPTAR